MPICQICGVIEGYSPTPTEHRKECWYHPDQYTKLPDLRLPKTFIVIDDVDPKNPWAGLKPGVKEAFMENHSTVRLQQLGKYPNF